MSPDGQWRWDGTQWVPAAPPPPPAPPGAGYPGAPVPYGGSPYQAPTNGTNGLAIASLVLGILWMFGLGSLLAVIFGFVGKKQIKERNQGGNGLATAGLVLGFVGLAGMLFFILSVAVFSSKLSQAEGASVRSDLRNAATAEETYLTDNNVYTNQLSALESEGLRPSIGTTLDFGFDGSKGYCLVGSFVGRSTWYLYDSNALGLQVTTYGSDAAAEAACSDPNMSFSGPQ